MTTQTTEQTSTEQPEVQENVADHYAPYGVTVASRNPSWHALGNQLDHAMTSAQALAASGLGGWNVRKVPLQTSTGLIVPDRVATVRTDPTTGQDVYLHYVGHNYHIHQNEETFEFLDALVDEGGAHYDTAGFFNRGKKIFISMKLPTGIKIGGEDDVDLYTVVTNGHDGNSAFEVSVTPVRLACTNQLRVVVKNALQHWKIKHTSGMNGRVSEARESLELTFDYADEFATEMDMLLDQAYTDSQFEQLTQRLFPDAKNEGAHQDTVEAKRAQMQELFTEADTNAFGRGTKYAAFNAVTEWVDWFAPVRGEDPEGRKRALRTFEGDGVQHLKDFALGALRA